MGETASGPATRRRAAMVPAAVAAVAAGAVLERLLGGWWWEAVGNVVLLASAVWVVVRGPDWMRRWVLTVAASFAAVAGCVGLLALAS